MNQRQKKKQIKKRNKELISRYPFLLPRSVWAGKVVKGYNYTWTDYDCIEPGWRKAFGKMLLEELRESLIKHDYLNEFQFSQIKEKYGSLRMYNFGAPEETCNILQKYEIISQYVCVECGKPDVPIISDYGWYIPICEKCYSKRDKQRKKYGCSIVPYSERIKETAPEDMYIPDFYVVSTYSQGESKNITYDISDTTDKIRKSYYKQTNY